MKKLILTSLILFASGILFAQESQKVERKFTGPIWTYHDLNSDIAGVSIGFFPNEFLKDTSLTRTYGIRVEAFILSSFYFLAPGSPISETYKSYEQKMKGTPTQQIYGFNLASGTFENIDVHGVSATMFIHYSRKNNGISASGLINIVERGNGIFIAPGSNQLFKGNGLMASLVWGNFAYEFHGLQISGENHISKKGAGIQVGLFNKSNNFKGFQLGLWNVNEKRKLPLINWSL